MKSVVISRTTPENKKSFHPLAAASIYFVDLNQLWEEKERLQAESDRLQAQLRALQQREARLTIERCKQEAYLRWLEEQKRLVDASCPE